MNPYLDRIEKQTQEFKSIQEQMRKKMQEELQSIFKDYFEKLPEVTCVSWRQYTPYFNDGEPCVFSSWAAYAACTNSTDYTSLKYGEVEPGEDQDDETVWSHDPDYGDTGNVPVEVITEHKLLISALAEIPKEVYLRAFGDHVRVFVTRDGVEVQEYDHD